MSNLEKQKELAKEAVKLIKEFKKESELISENFFKSVRANKSGSKITILDEYEGKKEYELTEISTVVGEELNGFGPCGSGFYEAIEEAKLDTAYKLKELSKTEFIKYMGTISYIKYRSEAIYERLKKIEKEAEGLI